MARALVGAVAAAVAMFIIGFIFYATPLQKIAVANLDDGRAAVMQNALAVTLPKTGTYFVPDGDTREQANMYSRGPVATIHYNMGGFAIGSPDVMIAGFVHMLIVALLMAAGLYGLSRHVPGFTDRFRLLMLGVLGATIFMRLGTPIWYHHDWPWAIYLFVADTVSLAVAGLIILKLLPNTAAAAVAAPAGGTTSDL